MLGPLQPITSAIDDDGVEIRWLEPYTGDIPHGDALVCHRKPMYVENTPPTHPICTLHAFHNSPHAELSNSGLVLTIWAQEVYHDENNIEWDD
jgi:hypothetical protein